MTISLSQRFKFIFHVSVLFRRLKRKWQWFFDRSHYSNEKSKEILRYCVVSHSSVLIRKLKGVNLQLQYNKIKNLRIVSEILNGLLIKPNEKFSFYKLVGKPSKKRGFVKGLELSRGKMEGAIGGGLCQIANMLHWMILHTDMTILERHHHSVDIFPDVDRRVPFGTGATLFYNFKDFVFINNTRQTYQLLMYVDDEYLRGEIRCDNENHEQYSVFEKGHGFEKKGNVYYRKNEIWRKNLKNGKEEMLFSNYCKILYTPSKEMLSDSNSF